VTPSPKSLIVDLLSTLPRSENGSMPVRALVAAGRCFGLAENSIRVALARLLSAGTVDRDERGHYRLGDRTEATRSEVAGWKTRHEDVLSWSERRWTGVLAPPRTGRAPRTKASRRERALLLLGFHRFDAKLYLRPDNLAGGTPRTRDRLTALDPTVLTDGTLVTTHCDLDEASERRALALWDGLEAVQAYGFSRQRLADSEARLPGRSREEAMVETFLTGGQVLRQIALDPLLPEEIVPAAERAALVDAMRGYDRVGRACWAGFLEGFDVPHMRTPADVRVADAPLPDASSIGANL
jgi:phenylacetic acid degradation operon negative regulatory protein